jgi:ATP-dependent DNA ligase
VGWSVTLKCTTSQTIGERQPGAIIDKSELDKLPRVDAAFIEPMQAKLIDKLPEGDEWEYEAKFDGY